MIEVRGSPGRTGRCLEPVEEAGVAEPVVHEVDVGSDREAWVRVAEPHQPQRRNEGFPPRGRGLDAFRGRTRLLFLRVGDTRERRAHAAPRARFRLLQRLERSSRSGRRAVLTPAAILYLFSGSARRRRRYDGRNDTKGHEHPIGGHSGVAASALKTLHLQGILRWRDPDSNRGHHDFQSCALPTELSRRGRGG